MKFEIRSLTDPETETLRVALLNLENSGNNVQKWAAKLIREEMLDSLMWLTKEGTNGNPRA